MKTLLSGATVYGTQQGIIQYSEKHFDDGAAQLEFEPNKYIAIKTTTGTWKITGNKICYWYLELGEGCQQIYKLGSIYYWSQDVLGGQNVIAQSSNIRRGKNQRSHSGERKTDGSGSGFLVSNKGYVVTNQHVVDGCAAITISEKEKIEASIIAEDERNDLAVILAKKTDAQPLSLRVNRQVKLAEEVVALGYPLQSILAKQLHVTTGTVTALAGIGSDTRFIQVSAPIQPGDSGGPIIDKYGNVVAMATSKLNAVAVAGVTGDIPQNVNFGVKASVIGNFLDVYQIPYSKEESSVQRNKTQIVLLVKNSVVFIKCHVK